MGQPKSQGANLTPPPSPVSLSKGLVWKTGSKGRALFFPVPKKKGGEPDLPTSCVKSRVSAISDVLRCLWWARPLEPNQRGGGLGERLKGPPSPALHWAAGPGRMGGNGGNLVGGFRWKNGKVLGQTPPKCTFCWGTSGGGQAAHPATFSTAPVHQQRGSANAETTPARAPAAVADRTQRPNATCEGNNGSLSRAP